MDSVHGDLCRVTVIAPASRIDVALPAGIPMADLVPTLLMQAGENLPDHAGAGGAWSLQRFGGARLDLGRSATALALRDGEILYLRPRVNEIPQLAFDDVADAIATGAASRPRWNNRDTRWAGLTVTAVGLAVILAIVVRADLSPDGVLITSAGLGLGLLAIATALSRVYAEAHAGALVGLGSAAFAGLAAAAAFADVLATGPAGGSPGGTSAGRGTLLTGSESVLAASAAILVFTVVAAMAVSVGIPWFVGLGVAAALATLGGLLDVAAGMDAPNTAAVTAAVALGLTPAVPGIALRIAQLPRPAIPASGEEVRRDVAMVAGADVLRRTTEADRLVTGLIAALAAVVAGSQLLIAGESRGTAPWLMALLAAATALRARAFPGRVQRAALLVAATVGAGALALSSGAVPGDLRPFLVVAAVLVIVGVSLTAGLRIPEHRPSPAWRWTADVLEALIVVSIVPVTLAVLGVYGYVRGLTGG